MANLRAAWLLAAVVVGCGAWATAGEAVGAVTLTPGTPGGRPLLHGLFNDRMVLQRDAPVPVWGWCAPGTEVAVSFAGQSKTAKAADPDGRWQVELEPLAMNAAGQKLTVVAGDRKRELSDVLVGDVWLAGGQSNMELGITATNQYWNEMGTHPGIRLYLNPAVSNSAPLAGAGGRWELCTPAGLENKAFNPHGGFSAIAYMFARAVNRETKIPLGVIQSCQGNTDIDTWMNPEALLKEHGAPPREHYARKVEEAFAKGDPNHAATAGWKAPGFDDSAWETVALPQGFRNRPERGTLAWFRRTVAVPPEWAGAPIYICLGGLSHHDTLWVDDQFVGTTMHHQKVRWYVIPGEAARDGNLQLTLRVKLEGGFLGPADSMWLLGSEAPPERKVSLAGDWRMKVGSQADEVKVRLLPECWMYSANYQGMIEPLAPFALKGFIWYQGCGNVGNSRTYPEKYQALIAEWRRLFRTPEGPFYAVQLAGYGKYRAEPQADSGWARIRAIQSDIVDQVPNTGFAVAFDRGDQFDIHPMHKREVAERLAKVALAQTYGQKAAFRGPQCKGVRAEGGKLVASFAYAEGLKSIGGAPAGFSIAGADGKFRWAQARIEGTDVVLWSEEVPAPRTAAFAWGDNTLFNCYNGDDLPMVPFRRDAAVP